MNLRHFYAERIDQLNAGIKTLRHRNRYFVMGEIISFVAVVGFVVLFTLIANAAWTLYASALCLVAYFLIRRADVLNGERIARLEDMLGVYRHEQSYMEGDYSCFDDGSRFVDSHHPFTFDLDVFGCDSLFNRVNRTITTGGSSLLAEYLSLGDAASDRSEAIACLSRNEPWRSKFVSFGQRGGIDTSAIKRVLAEVNRVRVSPLLASWALFVVAWASVVGLFVSVVLSVLGIVSYNVPIWWGIIQFFIVLLLTQKPLRIISGAFGRLHDQLKSYINVIRHCVDLGDDIPEMKSYTASLGDAILSFRQLEKVLDGIDRRGNVLGLFLFDALFLSDLFLVRRFFKWQRAYLGKIDSWIDTVSGIDALVSMATFRYNHPETCRAEIVDGEGVEYSAKGLYHPFLRDKAVKNDFLIADDNYYIITGANMAGKSTFLRSVGVNYILAMNGMPVFADSLTVSRFNLFSSMRTTDDLAHGISYFNAELLRLKQLIDYCKDVPHTSGTACGKRKATLIILDEILKGTNSLDKLNGSRLFLDYISRQSVTGIIATHDLELSKMADENPERFHNYCFEIKLGTDVTYTYKITPGVARNQNATFLLSRIIS